VVPRQAQVDEVGYEGFPTMAVLHRLLNDLIQDDQVRPRRRRFARSGRDR
jgi:hypothetical protein